VLKSFSFVAGTANKRYEFTKIQPEKSELDEFEN